MTRRDTKNNERSKPCNLSTKRNTLLFRSIGGLLVHNKPDLDFLWLHDGFYGSKQKGGRDGVMNLAYKYCVCRTILLSITIQVAINIYISALPK